MTTTISATLDESILLAAKEGCNEEIRRLRVRGANVNARNEWDTPVFWAALYSHVESLWVLLALGVDLDKKYMNGELPSILLLTPTSQRASACWFGSAPT